MVLGRLFPVAMLVACSSGCLSDSGGNRALRQPASVKPTLEAVKPEAVSPAVVRSQSPPGPPGSSLVPASIGTPAQAIVPASLSAPATAPITKIVPIDEASTPRGDVQVRIVATIGNTPIYELEVREAVYQRAQEMLNLPSFQQKAKEKEMFNQELKRIIEREMILDEMLARLKSQKRSAQIDELHKISGKDADTRMGDIRKRLKIPNDEGFKNFLEAQGLTVEGLHRHFERGTMMNIFLSELVKARVKSISLADLKDFYDEHNDLFRTIDRVKWQDLLIRKDRFKNAEDARKYTEHLADRARKGEDFVKMVETLDHRGLSSADGLGEERGQILPADVEPTVFALKEGEVGIVEMEACFHVVRIAERTYAGTKPFTDVKVQNEVRKRIEGRIGQREYQKLVDSLWTKCQPHILIDVAK